MEEKKFNITIKNSATKGFSIDMEINAMEYKEALSYLTAYIAGATRQIAQVWKLKDITVMKDVNALLEKLIKDGDKNCLIKVENKFKNNSKGGLN